MQKINIKFNSKFSDMASWKSNTRHITTHNDRIYRQNFEFEINMKFIAKFRRLSVDMNLMHKSEIWTNFSIKTFLKV